MSIKIDFESYKDSVYACWIGKNIGGTMGAPYEMRREILDVKGFSTAPGKVLPNDDLDLQLVWLLAVERLGAKAVNTALLGEFWLSYVVPNWNEYGIGKTNLERGLISPLSGDYQNDWQNSNGAWIRTEIWACLAPGCPDIAAKYAIADAQVDHGTGEGTYAAAFVAAMQAAAFVIKDLRKCIDIGLARIPKECRMADSVRTVLECYDSGKDAIETRNIILERNMDIGDGWFEAPSNVSYAIIGLLYGDGDFKKSMITAINCGDDTDCTAATVGATLGILGGQGAIPEDWKAHIGDDIITVAINRGFMGNTVPTTCTELSERVIKQAPHMLFANNAPVEIVPENSEIPQNILEILLNTEEYSAILERVKPNSAVFESAFLSAILSYEGEPEIAPFEEKKLHITFKNNNQVYDYRRYNLELRWWLPDGFTVEGGKRGMRLCYKNTHISGDLDLDVTIRAGDTVEAVNRCVLEVTAVGRSIPLYIPIVLLS
jgi:ADP-ribosylglycohydrolase